MSGRADSPVGYRSGVSGGLHIAAVALGANLGDRWANLCHGVLGLSAQPGARVIARGPLVQSAPMVPDDAAATPESAVDLGGEYLNTAVLLETRLSPRVLLEACHRIEAAVGRDRQAETRRWMPRTLDLDIVLYDDLLIDEPGLTIPHPGLVRRPFVLEPLAAIWPNAKVPPEGRTVRELWAECRSAVAETAR